ncbi:MAG TPA: hypothetical protein VIL36_03965, partial [Acidimicrobiales bacterium]
AEPGGLRHFTGEIRTGALEKAWSGFQPTYGYIEARVKLHQAPDTYSAFWLLSRDWHRSPWADPAASGPEIDIFEIGNPDAGDLRNEDTGAATPDGLCDWQKVRRPCDEIAGGTLHWGGFDEHHTRMSQQVPWDGPSPQDNFITYGLLWTPDGYRMYRNGTEVFHSTEPVTYSPEHLLLEQFQGGGIAGDPPTGGYGDLATSPHKMVIDYVKVWQRPVSDIPDRTVAASSPVAIPFTVGDYVSASGSATVGDGLPRPEGVQVAVTGNTNPALVPNDRIVVTGDEPLDANGSLANAGFESGTSGWNPSGSATTWTTRKRSGTNSARLTQAGGRIEQTITGLRPNTTYTVGGFYNLELGFTDTHTRTPEGEVVAGGDGRLTWLGDADGDGVVDQSELEPVAESGDLVAEFDMGIVDTDASKAGNQELRATRSRNGWQEARNWWSLRNTEWQEDWLTFTTGPGTTSVTFFVDNTVGTDPAVSDGDLSFDDVFVRPLTPPDRTVALRPVDGATGSTQITLTAWVDADGNGSRGAGEDLGSEQFTVTFTNGSSFTNGDFESWPEAQGWELWDGAGGLGADLVVEDPFQPNRVLELAGPGWQPDLARRSIGTAHQRVTNLAPGTTYTLSVTGKGGLFFRVQGYAGADPCATPADCEITTSDWSTKTIDFTAGASGTATLAVADWAPGDGRSLVDDITLTTASPTTDPPLSSPLLTALGEQRLTESSPVAVPFSLSNGNAGTAVTSVTSSNQALIPDTHLAVTPGAQHKALSITPIRDRTGKATITVEWTLSGAPQPAVQIPVVVSDEALVNGGFEHVGNWDGAAIATTGQRNGGGALQVDGTTVVKQTLNGLPDRTPFVLSGWVDGSVQVKVRTVPDSTRNPASAYTQEFTGTWSGGAWTERSLRFETASCTSCEARSSITRATASTPSYAMPGGQVEITITDTNPNGPSLVDDLHLVQVPTASPLHELSLAHTHSAWNGTTTRVFDAGRVPPGAVATNGIADPAVVAVATNDEVPAPPGMGEVLPDSQVRVRRENSRRDFQWGFQARTSGVATQRTGRSTVIVGLTDPATGIFSWVVSRVTVNAGSLDNGDFQRGSNGWGKWTFGTTSWELVEKQRWAYLNGSCVTTASPCPQTIGPNDSDQVLRLSSGIVGYKVSKLVPGTQYVVQANALGSGSTLRAVANNGSSEEAPIPRWGTTLGSVTIDSQTWAPTPDLVFTPMADNPATTTRDESEVWIFVWDDDDPDTGGPVVPASERACARYAAGETCIDDIGLFVADDLGL